MRIALAIASGAAAHVLWTAACQAGPCANEIYQTDIALGKRLDAAAARGKPAPESTFATTHHQPTPSTIAGAEEKVGDLSEADARAIDEFMEESRKADAANDRAGCQKALAEAQKVLAHQR